MVTFCFDCEPVEDMESTSKKFKARYEAIGSAIRAGILTATSDIEVSVREELGLPEIPASAIAYWKKTAGVRRPITLQGEDEESNPAALALLSAIADKPSGDANPFPEFRENLLAAINDDAELDSLLSTLAAGPEALLERFGTDTDKLAGSLARETIAAAETAAREVN